MTEYAWFDVGEGRQVFRKVEDRQPARSNLPMPMLARDQMDPVQSQLDGKLYDSKSALRRTYKQAGVVEVGNDPARLRPPPKPKQDEAGVRRTIEKAIARHNNGERVRP